MLGSNNIRGFSLVEMMVVMAIFSVMGAVILGVLMTGRDSWHTTDTQISLRENVRIIMSRVSRELQESGSSGGSMQVTIDNGGGVNGSDILRFSMPVICQQGGVVIDANGDVAYWGAPLTWGCSIFSCMDGDDDCSTVDYKFVEYKMDGNNQLLRRVLNPALTAVREDVFAENVTDFQVVLGADSNLATLTVTVSRDTESNRTITSTESINVFFRNRG